MSQSFPRQNFNPQALPSGTCLGDYEISDILGGGGFGITYLAVHRNSGVQVVIKENLPAEVAYRDWNTLNVVPLKRGNAEETYKWSLNSFFKEAQTLGKLNHRYIVSVYEAFECNNTAYFVMPYIEGMDLLEWFEASGSPTGRAAFLEQYFLMLLEALEHVHEHCLCHRDVKPSNILVTREGLPLLIDFGAARDSSSEATRTVLATIGYAPVEQLESHGRIGPWTDIYALGATFYRILTGEEPPLAISRVRHDAIRSLSEDKGLLTLHSKPFLTALDYSLQINEADRPQSCRELAGLVISSSPSIPRTSAESPSGSPVQGLRTVSGTERKEISRSGKMDPEESPFLSQWLLLLGCISCIGAVVSFTALQSKEGKEGAWSAFFCLSGVGAACLIGHFRRGWQGRGGSSVGVVLAAYNNETQTIANYITLQLGKSNWAVSLGRRSQKDDFLYLPNNSTHASISRRHATVFYTGGQLYIRNDSRKLPLIWNGKQIRHEETVPVSLNESGNIGHYTIYFQ